MGLVKFNNTTLNIAEIPDGHIVISDTDYQGLRNVNNSFLALKSKIPIGVNESEISSLIEKGQRYDPVNTELANTKTTLSGVQQQLATASMKLPDGITIDKVNQWATKEKNEIKAGKIATHTKNVIEKLKAEKPNVPPPNVGEMFLPADKVANFNPDVADAEAQWAVIMSEGLKAQQAFLKTQAESGIVIQNLGGGPTPTGPQSDIQPASDTSVTHL